MNLLRTEKDIVLSSRIRLARNVKGYNFSPSLSIEDMAKLEKKLSEAIASNPEFNDYSIYKINELDELDRIVLKEKKIISERYYRHGQGLVITDDRQMTSIITGDLDHIRISSVKDGLNMEKAFAMSSAIEEKLSRHFDFAKSDDEGYLTVNVSDSGLAMKGSIFLHLPVLCASDLMDQYIINTIETMLEVTGFTGGGAHSLGGLYIISNKNSFFSDEKQLIELLNKTARLFIDSEREARDKLLDGKYPGLEDEIFRAFGILKYCRQISEQEAISALSVVRLGIAVGWIESLTVDDVTQVLGIIGNGFLRSFAYENNPDETDIMRIRAEKIRKNLNIL